MERKYDPFELSNKYVFLYNLQPDDLEILCQKECFVNLDKKKTSMDVYVRDGQDRFFVYTSALAYLHFFAWIKCGPLIKIRNQIFKENIFSFQL